MTIYYIKWLNVDIDSRMFWRIHKIDIAIIILIIAFYLAYGKVWWFT